MKKDLFLYTACSVIMGGACLIQLWMVPFFFIRFCMVYFLICLGLGITHFIPRFRSNSPSPSVSAVLGSAWLLLTQLFLLITASYMGYFSVPEDLRLLILPRFLLYWHAPFFIIWLLLSILVSTSLIVKRPFWLVERKAKYIQVLGILLCLYIVAGIRHYWISVSTEVAGMKYSTSHQNELTQEQGSAEKK